MANQPNQGGQRPRAIVKPINPSSRTSPTGSPTRAVSRIRAIVKPTSPSSLGRSRTSTAISRTAIGGWSGWSAGGNQTQR